MKDIFEAVLVVLGFIVLVAAISCIMGFFTMWIWNAFVPSVTGFSELTLVQGVLFNLLFSIPGIGHASSKSKSK